MTRLKALFILLIALSLSHTVLAYHPKTSDQFVVITDLHFNPYASCNNTLPCPLIDALQQAPISQWERLLKKAQPNNVSYGSDTNYPLMQSAFNELSNKIALEKPSFVVVLGDILAHDYRKNYMRYASLNTQESYQAFTIKTIEFLNTKLTHAFPSTDIYMTIGNNDTYGDHYDYNPDGQIYKDIVTPWSNLLSNTDNRAAMQEEFPVGGYYAVTIPEYPMLRLIVMNTVLFSLSAKGNDVDKAAKEELDWLQNELDHASAKNQKILIALHIPPGVDAFSSAKLKSTIELWKPEYTERFMTEIEPHSASISAILAGHYHMDFFQIIKNHPNADPILVLGTPAISPLFGNNPGFKVYRFSTQHFEISDAKTYYYSINDIQKWQQEYDFNKIYQPDCQHCQLMDAVSSLTQTSAGAERYKYFYGVGTNSQPITDADSWHNYWCSMYNVFATDYQTCLKS